MEMERRERRAGFPEPSGEQVEPGRRSRAQLFKLGAVGAGALAAGLIDGALAPEPAGAATGGTMLIGQANVVTAANDVTQLTGALAVVSANTASFPAGGFPAVTGQSSSAA